PTCQSRYKPDDSGYNCIDWPAIDSCLDRLFEKRVSVHHGGEGMVAFNLPRFAMIVLILVVGLTVVPTASAAVTLPDQEKIERVDFERHIMGLFGRMGCNSGSCHGSFQGKGGFRLSLFGYDPAMDHAALTREALGRRINPVDPDQSLLLQKATAQAKHE